MLQADLQVVRHVTGGDDLTLVAVQYEPGKEWPGCTHGHSMRWRAAAHLLPRGPPRGHDPRARFSVGPILALILLPFTHIEGVRCATQYHQPAYKRLAAHAIP